jgi:hypothetical protein
MKKSKQLFLNPQDAYEKAWATDIRKNPCNLWKSLNSPGAYESAQKNLSNLGKSFNTLGANLGNL